MKPLSFLRDTLWVGYALHFQPTALERRLHAQLSNQLPDGNPTRLWDIVSKLDQPAARRYLAQVALLSALAALPFLLLASGVLQPPSLAVLGLIWMFIVISGLGAAAIWDATIGMGIAMVLALFLGSLNAHGQWLTVVASAEISNIVRQGLVPGILAVVAMGFILGLVAGRQAKPVDDLVAGSAGLMAFLLGSATAGTVADSMASDMRGTVAGATMVVVLMVMAGGVTGYVAVGVAPIVARVVAGVEAGAVAGAMTTAVTLVVAGLVAGLVAVSMAVGAAALPFFSPLVLAAMGILLGVSLGSRQWTRRSLLFNLGFLGFIGLIILLSAPTKAALWLVSGVFGFLRLPIYAFEAAGIAFAYGRLRSGSSFTKDVPASEPFLPIWRYDELIPFPLPFLDRLLVIAVQNSLVTRHKVFPGMQWLTTAPTRSRQAGLALIEEVAGTWRQGVMAQRAMVNLTALELASHNDESSIAAAARDLAWLPEVVSPTVQGTVGRFRTVSTMLDEKRSLTDSEAQLAQLSRTTAALDDMIQGLTFVPRRERELFLPVARQWRDVLRRATTRLPNPYVAGDPLRGNQPGLFVGREDVLRDMLVHLADRSQRPTLVLFGQRRMGKSSLLYQLPHKFGDDTVPVRVDCQAAEMQENNPAFLFNLARAIQSQAREFRQIEGFPSLPPLVEMTATAFSQWLETVEDQLGDRVLLLCLDEFERIGEAVNRGWLDERILDLLRNLIQHHPQVTLLLAGSHRPNEIGRPWSNYLISAVVLPIGYLQPSEVETLVTQPIPGFPLHYRPEAVQHIIELTRCQPLLVQLLCQQLVILLNERGEREAGVVEIEAAVPGALAQGGSLYFTYLAEYDAGKEGQNMLRELARRGPSATMPEDALTHGQPARREALRRLLARDLVERADGGIRFEVDLARRWWAGYGLGGEQ